VLSGFGGVDRLWAGSGVNTLTGGSGDDVYVFNVTANSSNRGVITDFANAKGNNDTIWLDNDAFTKLGSPGALNSALFFKGAAAHDSNDYIIYNSTTGKLYYDDDGTGSHAQVEICTITNKANISAGDFTVMG
jgi:serralysin